MRYIADHDLHIHTCFSPCSSDARQTPEAILAYGLTNGFRLLSLADHSWDMTVPCLSTANWGPLTDAMSCLPLPQSPKCHLIFGMEADMNYLNTLGLSPEIAEKLDFCVLSTSHMHTYGFGSDPERHSRDAAERKARYQERLHTLLDLPLPFYKCGLSHFTFAGVCVEDPLRWLQLFSDGELTDIFTKAAKKEAGIELNFNPDGYKPDDLKIILRPYFLAKEAGCTFYFGGDAHHPETFGEIRRRFERIIDLLELEERHKMPYISQIIARLESGEESLGSRGL